MSECPKGLNVAHDVHTLNNLTEHDVLPVEPRSLDCRDEKLRAVGVRHFGLHQLAHLENASNKFQTALIKTDIRRCHYAIIVLFIISSAFSKQRAAKTAAP